ncbi:MAG: MFS transporter [Hyphomicrobium sp.]|nr:MAG: MFS transporter [Hyphomicrobium sp.]PPD00426.1 MAG: MFS transporter [Hyphomicrobium sp.]
MRLLPVLATSCFVSSMSMRIVDPVVPDIARDMAISAASAALLASAFTFPYALGQPLLGALGDTLGKARIIKISLAVMMLCLLAAAIAPSIDALYAARIIGGAAGGGIIPLAFALVGDRFAMLERQVALSKLLSAIIAGQLTGSVGSGLIASQYGWRVSFVAATALAFAALAMTLWQLKPRPLAERPPFKVSALGNGYRSVFKNPRTIVCFTAVFIEGIVVFGLFPYLAVMLEQRGAGGLKEAGFVLAGFALGGFIYTALVRVMLDRLGLLNVMRVGGALAGLGFATLTLGGSWPVEMAVFVLIGVGFYMLHNSLQTQATELAPDARGSAVAAHAFFFFLGQAVGPIAYRIAFDSVGTTGALLAAAVMMTLTGMLTAAGLSRRGV